MMLRVRILEKKSLTFVFGSVGVIKHTLSVFLPLVVLSDISCVVFLELVNTLRTMSTIDSLRFQQMLIPFRVACPGHSRPRRSLRLAKPPFRARVVLRTPGLALPRMSKLKL